MRKRWAGQAKGMTTGARAEQPPGRARELLRTAEAREELVVGGAREEGRSPAGTPGRKSTVESKVREAMVEAWQLEPGKQLTEIEMLAAETQVEMKN